jgi:hypothetical protein
MTELRFKTSGAFPGALAMVGLRTGGADQGSRIPVGLAE